MPPEADAPPGGADADLRRAVIAAARDLVTDALGLRRDADRVLRVAAEAAAIAEALSAQSREQLHPPPTPIACRAGCSWCCHQDTILVSPLEVFALGPAIAARQATAARHRSRSACPLLADDGRCSVYADRPLKCRGYTSLDVAACEAMATHDPAHKVPVYWPQFAHHDWVQAGLVLGVRDLGLQADLLVLRRAVAFLKDRAGLVHPWLAGNRVFLPHLWSRR